MDLSININIMGMDIYISKMVRDMKESFVMENSMERDHTMGKMEFFKKRGNGSVVNL